MTGLTYSSPPLVLSLVAMSLWHASLGAVDRPAGDRPQDAIPQAPAITDDSVTSRRDEDVSRLARWIDDQLQQKQAAAGIVPAPRADDAEFHRRVRLHLAGVIPTPADCYEFFDDPRPDRDRRLVDRLLQSPEHIHHTTVLWRKTLLPEADTDQALLPLIPGFEQWLHLQLAARRPYDELVRELLTADVAAMGAMMVRPAGPTDPSPAAFFLAKQAKPENIAAASSRVFLGQRIECAQCHDHPFDTWKRDQFWGYAAFFASLVNRGPGDEIEQLNTREVLDRREMRIPETDRVVQARFLDGQAPEWRPRVSARQTLAQWMTSPDNVAFQQATVNRLWAHLFGQGIVEPLDDFSVANAPSHPEILTVLGQEFARHDFDLTFVMQVLTATEAYRRTSLGIHHDLAGDRFFERMPVQALPGAVVARNIQRATGRGSILLEPERLFQGPSEGTRLESLFRETQESPVVATTSILQALRLMNGSETQGPLPALEAIQNLPGADWEEQLEAVWMLTLSRRPTEQELQDLRTVANGLSATERRQWLEDQFWVRLNSSEFLFNF